MRSPRLLLSKALTFRSWSEHHSKVFMSTAIAQANVVKYIQVQSASLVGWEEGSLSVLQYHVDVEGSAVLAAAFPVLAFDGAVEFYGRSLEELAAVS